MGEFEFLRDLEYRFRSFNKKSKSKYEFTNDLFLLQNQTLPLKGGGHKVLNNSRKSIEIWKLFFSYEIIDYIKVEILWAENDLKKFTNNLSGFL